MAALRLLLDAASRPRLDQDTARAVAALEAYRAWLRSRVEGMPATVATGRDAYVVFLRQVALLPFSPEQILAMGRQEWARSVAAEALESRRDRGLPELPLLASQAAQIARARRDELPIRGFLERRGILTVPAWMPHYIYRPLPAYLAPLAAFRKTSLDSFSSPPTGSGSSSHLLASSSSTIAFTTSTCAAIPRGSSCPSPSASASSASCGSRF